MAYILDDDPPRAATMNDRERGRLLGILHEIGLDRASSDLREFALTQAALALRATWEQVADASGVSQPQAQERYEALRKRFTPPEQVAYTTQGPVPAYPLNLPPACPVPPTPADERATREPRSWEYPVSGFAAMRLNLPPEMADPRYSRIIRATEEWAEAIPGLQCRLSSPGEQIIYFRLTPAEDAP
jgi:hypothetical protein